MNQHMIPAEHFMSTLAVNVNNEKLSDAEFRAFVRNTMPIVQYPRKRTIRCAHGVHEDNRCEKCD